MHGKRWCGGIVLALAVVAAATGVRAEESTGGIALAVDGTPLLRYQHTVVSPPAGYRERIPAQARRYAVVRSGYLHPLFGPHGEELTADWSHDHPHHRGVYWAWPEVVFRGEMKDLHALQGVFSRPVGKPEVARANDGAAELHAVNQWMWNDETPIVREEVTIRGAKKNAGHDRYVDLTIKLAALEEGVTIARRQAKLYGGLNIRLAPVTGLKLVHHADPVPTAVTAQDRQVAWQYASGVWRGANEPTTLVVFEDTANPGYPGDYIQYPNLPWFQPTFPPAGQRYELKQDKPLTLRYRFWIVDGAAPDEEQLRNEWSRFNPPAKE